MNRQKHRYSLIFFVLSMLLLSACASTGDVRGAITLDGAPLANIKVELSTGSNTVTETQTDGNGEFKFEEISPGSYVIDAQPGQCHVLNIVHVEAGKQAVSDFKWKKFDIQNCGVP